MSEKYTGFKTFEVPGDLVESLHYDGKVLIWDKRYTLYPNMYIELKDSANPKHTGLGKVSSDQKWIERIHPKETSGVTPRNREQAFALDALMDDEITTVVLTGIAGTGKTLLTLAVALQKVQEGRFSKVILTRPMSHVGKYPLGALPGDVDEKFSPYLLNYTTNLERFVGKDTIRDLMDQCQFDIIPLQLIRGASFNDCLVIADEVQICNHMEILTIGSRIGQNSKIVLLGDLNQRDEKIAREKTGLYRMMNDKKAKESPLVASLELIRCERSATARLFAEIFEE